MHVEKNELNPGDNKDPQLLTKDEAMAFMKIKVGVLYKFISQEEDPLPVAKLGSLMWFEKSDILGFFQKHKENTAKRLAARNSMKKKVNRKKKRKKGNKGDDVGEK